MTTVRILGPGDEDALMAFLRARTDTTMFMQGNLGRAGIEDHGERFQATYVGVFDGDELVGAVAHAWNGMFLLEAQLGLIDALDAALRAKGRAVKGFSGALDQVSAARSYLCLDEVDASMDSAEVLYGLDLEDLRVPPGLTSGAVQVRRAEADDLSTLLPWSLAYYREAIDEAAGEEAQAQVESSLRSGLDSRTAWIAHVDGGPVAMTRFNATTPHAVQVGGVYTPPEFRARGYGGCVVAQSLLDARAEGATRSILFTPESNTPARRCYYGLGYEPLGAFGLVLLRETHTIALAPGPASEDDGAEAE
ncbi:MAG: GNAT family N-acetyltransferase [Planctomycetota bacterium]|nr:GNAT family N-acetyltransferase [Planctomycetota bacterium]